MAEDRRIAGEKLIRILAFTMVLSAMSATMFNIVLPEMRAEFQLTLSQVSWVSTIYLLIYAIGSVIYGKLADTYRLKNLLTFGLATLFAGSLLGLSAQSYGMVLAGRILQAAGAAVIPATSMIIPIRYFPAETRGRALGITASGLALGNAIGPVISALMVSTLHWRWLFCVPLLAVLTLPFYRKYLGAERGQGGKVDWPGGGLLAGTVALLLLAVTGGGWLPAAGSFVLFAAFLVRIRTAATPFVPIRLFRNKTYALGLVLGVLMAGIGFSIPFLTPQMLSDVHHLSPGWIGFAMVPAAAVSAVLGRKAGRLADAKGNPYLFTLASSLLLISFFLLSSFTGLAPFWIAAFLIFGHTGQMFMQIALANSISRTLPQEQTGVGMGLLTMLNFLSGAVSAGLYSRTVDQGAAFPLNPVNAFPDSFAYSNIYIVLAMAHVGILALYHYSFGKAARNVRKAA